MNLEQIAKLSGVSRSTASRVINNDRNVSEATREQVLRIVNLMNYAPNAAARSLAAGHTHVIGLMIPSDVSVLFADPNSAFIRGALATCKKYKHSAMFWFDEPHSEPRQAHPTPQPIFRGLFDGLLVVSRWLDDPLVQASVASAVPLVLVGRSHPDRNINYVTVDNRGAANEAVTHLLRLGRSRVATITGPHATLAGYDRLQGYCDALRTHGFPIEPELIAESDFTEMGGLAAMQRLLGQRIDAVFAANDHLALGALRALYAAGRRVPEDVAVVGFDDIPFAARANPPLTTVRAPLYQVGETAVEALLASIRNREAKPRRIVLQAELVVRSSCGVRRAELENHSAVQEEVICKSRE
jgi:LacI family transcriptional regulator